MSVLYSAHSQASKTWLNTDEKKESVDQKQIVELTARARMLENVVSDYMDEIRNQNKLMGEKRVKMTELRTKKSALEKKEHPSKLDEQEISQLRNDIDKLRGEIETFASTNSLEMVKLQQIMMGLQESLTILSNNMKTFKEIKLNAINNFK